MTGKKKRSGAATVFGAYVLWGLLPGFWTLLAPVNSVYILAQRIVWSLAAMAVYLVLARRMGEALAALRDRRVLGKGFLCGVLITLNWGIYIYAVNSGHVLDASMGYFIEPVLVVLIGVLLFRERPSPAEKAAFCCALAGVLCLMVRTGRPPVLALAVAVPFCLYGAVKKGLDLSAQASLLLETLLMLPFALAFCGWWTVRCGGSAAVMRGVSFWLLPACGVVTTVPLLLFNLGVKEIPYYLSGIIMYINPTLQFLMGVLVFHEALDRDRLLAFVLIWAGILAVVGENQGRIRREKRAL